MLTTIAEFRGFGIFLRPKTITVYRTRFEAIAREIHPESASDSLHSMNVSLKPGFVLDELKVSPGKFVQQRIEMIDGSVLG